MSGDLLLALAAAAAGPADAPDLAPPALVDRLPSDTAAPEPLRNALSVSIPSTDGMRGAQLSYERWFAAPRVAIGITGGLRETAEGDYTALSLGAGAHIRYFWRADAWLSRLPAGSPVGWFVGGGAHLGSTVTHDDVDHEWLGSTLRLGVTGDIGYRIAPWRHLVITPTAGIEVHGDFDISGRLSPWKQAGVTAGLEVGWLF